LYRTLHRTCRRYDKLLPRSREAQPLLPMLRVKARNSKSLTDIQQGFAELRKLRVSLGAAERWHGVFSNKKGLVPYESGALAIASVADPKVNHERVFSYLDHLSNEVKRQMTLESVLIPHKSKSYVFLKSTAEVLQSSGYRIATKPTVDDYMIDKFFDNKRGAVALFSLIMKSLADRLNIPVEIHLSNRTYYLIVGTADPFSLDVFDLAHWSVQTSAKQMFQNVPPAYLYHHLVQYIIDCHPPSLELWKSEASTLKLYALRVEKEEEEEKEKGVGEPTETPEPSRSRQHKLEE